MKPYLQIKKRTRVFWESIFVIAICSVLTYLVADGCQKRVRPPLPVSPPAIVTQPTSQNVPVGQGATFSVVASGTGLAFQWQKNAQDIAGATAASYTVAAVQLADNAASFQVRISNSAGSVTSDAAILTVTPADTRAATSLTLTITPNPVSSGQALDLFAHLIFNGTANPTGGICIQENGANKNSCDLTPVTDEHWHTMADSLFPVGMHALTASYPGDANYKGSQSQAITLTVVAATPTITSITPDNGPDTGGTSITITGTGFKPGAELFFCKPGPRPAGWDPKTSPDCVQVQTVPITQSPVRLQVPQNKKEQRR